MKQKLTERKQELDEFTITLCDFQSKKLEEEEHNKSISNRRKKILQIRTDIRKIKNKKQTRENSKKPMKILSKINTINKPLARLTRIKGEITQIANIRN